jgi:hypothetical protein
MHACTQLVALLPLLLTLSATARAHQQAVTAAFALVWALCFAYLFAALPQDIANLADSPIADFYFTGALRFLQVGPVAIAIPSALASVTWPIPCSRL